MIKRIKLLGNIGQFDSVDAGQHIQLEQLTLVYADNGRGKTTLASVLRSLADGDPIPIVERKRLSSSDSPHVVLEASDGFQTLVFQDGAWNSTLPSLHVFDDTFVDLNVHSGLNVSPQHRQNFHDIVLGPEAVALSKRLDEQLEKLEVHIQQLRTKAEAIPAWTRGPYSVDDFWALPAQHDIDNVIQETEFRLAAARDQDAIATTQELELLRLPSFGIVECPAN